MTPAFKSPPSAGYLSLKGGKSLPPLSIPPVAKTSPIPSVKWVRNTKTGKPCFGSHFRHLKCRKWVARPAPLAARPPVLQLGGLFRHVLWRYQRHPTQAYSYENDLLIRGLLLPAKNPAPSYRRSASANQYACP